MRIFLLIFSVFLASQGISQEEERIDSLKSIIGQGEAKSTIDAYNELADLYWHSSPTSAIAYSDSAYRLIEQVNYPKGFINTYENKGIAAYTLGNYDSSEFFYRNAIEKSTETGIKSNAHLLYIQLLKKKGDFSTIQNTVNKLWPDSISISRADPYIITATADAFAESGNIAHSKKYLKLVMNNQLYKTDSVRRADFNLVLAKYLVLINDYDSASMVINQAIDIYESSDDLLGSAKAKLQLGSVNLILGNTKKAQELFTTALNAYDSAGYPFGVAEAKRHLGSFYSTISEFGTASEYLFDALDIYEEQNNLNEIAKIYNELAWIHKDQGMTDKAFNYIKRAIEISNNVGNKNVEATAYNIYGIILDNQKNHKKAVENYEKALALRTSIGDKKGVAATLYNIAFIKEAEGEYEEAEKMYLEAYELEKEIGNALGAAISKYTLGSLYTKTGQLKLAEKYLNDSRATLKQLESRSNLLFNYLYSAKLYEKKGDLLDANFFYKQYIALKDSLTDQRIRAQITELEIKYDLKNKDREIEFLNLENRARDQELVLKEQVIRNQRLFIGFVAVVGVLLLVLVFVGYRLLKVRNKTNEELKELNVKIQEKNEEITAQSEELQEANMQISIMNQNLEGKVGERTQELKKAYKELDTFFYRSSHDFRSPLTTFLGLSEVAKSTLDDQYALDLFKKVEITALRLDKMVNKLKAISLISDESLRTEEVDVKKMVNKSLEKWSHQIKSRHIEVVTNIEINKLNISSELFEIILDNLIENAVEYNTPANPKIKIDVTEEKGDLKIRVEDNGMGIAPKFHSDIFDMYFRANEISRGNGLGLYLVKKTVDRLEGSIKLKSEVNLGTTVLISIPLE